MDEKRREGQGGPLPKDRSPIEREPRPGTVTEDPDARPNAGDVDDPLRDERARDRRDPARPVQLDAEGRPMKSPKPGEGAARNPDPGRSPGKPQAGKAGSPNPIP